MYWKFQVQIDKITTCEELLILIDNFCKEYDEDCQKDIINQDVLNREHKKMMDLLLKKAKELNCPDCQLYLSI